MHDMLQAMDYWHWWTLAITFLVLEVLISGFYLAWLAVASAVVGLFVYFSPGMYWQQQWLMFGVISIVSLLAWFRFGPKNDNDESNGLNRRAEQYIGRTVVLDTAIKNGFGRIRLDDTLWRVSGTDLTQGCTVKIIRVDAGQMIVEPVED